MITKAIEQWSHDNRRTLDGRSISFRSILAFFSQANGGRDGERLRDAPVFALRSNNRALLTPAKGTIKNRPFQF